MLCERDDVLPQLRLLPAPGSRPDLDREEAAAMSSEDNANTIENVSFTILGNSFNLRCRKEQKETLLSSIAVIQQKTSKMLRDNPTLTPQQTAILTALEIQSTLERLLKQNTPFQDQAFNLTRQTRERLLQAEQTLKNDRF